MAEQEREKVVVALDCMGGDNAPRAIIEGAYLITKSYPNVHFLLYGDEGLLIPLLKEYSKLKNVSTIYHTIDVISSSEKPSAALRKGQNSSMRLAIDAVKRREANAVVSAGNTGALMVMSKTVLKPLPSIDRPAIVQLVPNQKKKATVLLDMGANIECDSDNLCQFAVMGNAFARVCMKVERPTIGLLNIGAEEMKGGDAIKNAALMLRDSELGKFFYGYVEGDDIVKGTVDVVVTDGFSGNVALKAIEGTASLLNGMIKEAFSSSLPAKLGYLLASRALKRLHKDIDPRMHNGAMFVGLNGITVKSHGNADKIAFANALEVAIALVKDNINDRIMSELRSYNFESTTLF